MARSRLIKPGVATNEFLATRSFEARLLFVMLPTITDREGRLEDRPRKIKAALFPYEQIDVDALLNELAACDDDQDHPFIVRYEADGQKLIQIVKFADNQSPHKEEKESELPPCEHDASTVQPPCSHDATLVRSTEQEPDARLKKQVTSNKVKETSNKPEPFDEWWPTVHLRKGKQAARRAYDSAAGRLLGEDPQRDPHAFLLDRMRIFAESPEADPPDREPIHPSTWLNQGRYDDDPATWQRRTSGADPRGTAAAVNGFLEDAKA